jgi:hypothetical protein
VLIVLADPQLRHRRLGMSASPFRETATSAPNQLLSSSSQAMPLFFSCFPFNMWPTRYMMTPCKGKENVLPDFKRSSFTWELVFWFLIVCGISLAIWQYFAIAGGG